LEQDWFVNGALLIETSFSPVQLLETTQAVQTELGSTSKDIRFGPRILDLDIIFFDQLVMDIATLTIPHPRMHKRRFVLKPICDIDPTVVHPVLGVTVEALLNQMVIDGQDMVECSSSC
jgi:2-amino-4-hydroxy-6-hydroxymethyldihydropteridine diphosphokinase